MLMRGNAKAPSKAPKGGGFFEDMFGTPKNDVRCGSEEIQGVSGIKKDALGRLRLSIWWRWRGSNPRPSILRLKIYMFRLLYLINPSRPESQGVMGEPL